MNIDPRMTKMRSRLILDHPFFGFLASCLQIIESPGIGTMAVDGKRWFYDPKFLDECNDPKLIFVGAHEVMHCALNHPSRRSARDPELWNIACDHVVNLSLQEAGFVVPTNCYCDQRFKGMGADDVFRILNAEKPQEQDAGQQPDPEQGEGEGSGEDQSDQNGDEDANDKGSQDRNDESNADANDQQSASSGSSGSNDSSNQQEDGSSKLSDQNSVSTGNDPSGNEGDQNQNNTKENEQPSAAKCSDPGRCGGVIDSAPEHDQAALDDMAQEWEVAVRQAVNLARRQGEGKLPGFLEEVIREINTPKVDWREILRAWIDPSSTKDYTWARPNRRMLPFDIISPGTTSDGVNHIGIVIDDSSSIDSDMLKQFAGETQSALDDGKIDKLTVVFCDDRVTRTAEYVMGDVIDFRALGRGGTRFSPAFKWFNENEPDVAGVVYLTDLICNDFGNDPSFRVLWAAYDPSLDLRSLRTRMMNVPFGECIELE